MREPDWIIDDQLRSWNNGIMICLNTAIFLILPIGLIVAFIDDPKYTHALWVGIVLLYLLYELGVNAYIRITYLNGTLTFERPLRRYSLLFRKRRMELVIQPDEWTELYWFRPKSSFAYYFRNDHTAAYFAAGDGFMSLHRKLEKLFPGRLKTSLDFPKETKKRMKKAEPGRVF
jgi:hypothetical protein